MRQNVFRIFVYGTLMRGGRNEAFLKGARLVSSDAMTLEAVFVMEQFNSSSSPGKQTPAVRKGGTGHVRGEVYEVDREGLVALDRLEQNGIRYRREAVALQDGTTAWMYVLMAGDAPSPRQDRIAFDPDRRAYAWLRAEPQP